MPHHYQAHGCGASLESPSGLGFRGIFQAVSLVRDEKPQPLGGVDDAVVVPVRRKQDRPPTSSIFIPIMTTNTSPCMDEPSGQCVLLLAQITSTPVYLSYL